MTLDANEMDACPVCAVPFKAGDTCATDIELGICHAECLEGSPTVWLDTGEPSDGPIDTYPYEPLSGADSGSLVSDPGIGVTSSPAARESEASAAALPHAGKVREVLRKALPFVGWSASRQQILSGVDAGELYIEIEAALVSQQSSGQSEVSDEMVEALSPFVRHYEKWMDDWADDEFSSTYSRHTFGQLRRARALLAGREATLSSQQAEAVPAGEPGIKALEWGVDAFSDVFARSPVGTYSCPKFHSEWDLLRDGHHMHPKVHGVIKAYPTLEAAKAAAHADYEARIRSVLVPATSPAKGGADLTDLIRCAEILAGLEDEDRGRAFPSKENCAFARKTLSALRSSSPVGQTAKEGGE